MKMKFLTILFLILSLQSLTKADDIRDFQIEGISIGDSLLDYFDKSYLKKAKRYDSTNTAWKDDKMFELRTKKKGSYTEIMFGLKKNDRKYTIYSISGLVKMENNIKECYQKQKEIAEEINELFPSVKKKNKNIKHRSDPTGKSTVNEIYFIFNEEKTISDEISVACYDWSKKMKYWDNLRITIASREFRSWIINEAYK